MQEPIKFIAKPLGYLTRDDGRLYTAHLRAVDATPSQQPVSVASLQLVDHSGNQSDSDIRFLALEHSVYCYKLHRYVFISLIIRPYSYCSYHQTYFDN